VYLLHPIHSVIKEPWDTPQRATPQKENSSKGKNGTNSKYICFKKVPKKRNSLKEKFGKNNKVKNVQKKSEKSK